MGRLIILTFFGSYRGSKESEEHIHEAPAVMLIPMVILAFGAVFAGYFWADSIGIKFFAETLAPVVGAAQAYNTPAVMYASLCRLRHVRCGLPCSLHLHRSNAER